MLVSNVSILPNVAAAEAFTVSDYNIIIFILISFSWKNDSVCFHYFHFVRPKDFFSVCCVNCDMKDAREKKQPKPSSKKWDYESFTNAFCGSTLFALHAN